MNFIAMDFETANNEAWSADSLGLTIVEDNQIVDNWYSLIKPETTFSYWNTAVNGLTADDVIDSPKFPDVWEQIKHLYADYPTVVGHNIRFDNQVLKQTLRYYGLPVPHYVSLDTVSISRKFHPDMVNHKLDTVASELGLDLEHHHNASFDAQAAAEILIYEINHFGEDRIKDFAKLV
ncbi:MAG: 3'-5' exonuclease [Oenococcus sp.]|uniref:3'-5' exonuclease n=1 Tax=Oenococcus sp. TaxID=1979414 RepID=UPI0039EAEA63